MKNSICLRKERIDHGMSRKCVMVYLRRIFKRSQLVLKRLSLVHHDRWDSIGMQCFKFAALSFFPFGKEVTYGGGAGSLLLNILWMIISGIPLALESALFGILMCITIVGIPFGLQHFKIAKLALMPFGAEVY